jgi:hypothetical protein
MQFVIIAVLLSLALAVALGLLTIPERPLPPPSPPPGPGSGTGPKTEGPCSPITTGNGNITNANCDDFPPKAAPKSDKVIALSIPGGR